MPVESGKRAIIWPVRSEAQSNKGVMGQRQEGRGGGSLRTNLRMDNLQTLQAARSKTRRGHRKAPAPPFWHAASQKAQSTSTIWTSSPASILRATMSARCWSLQRRNNRLKRAAMEPHWRRLLFSSGESMQWRLERLFHDNIRLLKEHKVQADLVLAAGHGDE